LLFYQKAVRPSLALPRTSTLDLGVFWGTFGSEGLNIVNSAMIDKTLVSDYKVGSSSKVPSEQGNLTRPGRFLDCLLDFFDRGSLA
jgi:hypothetical protein